MKQFFAAALVLSFLAFGSASYAQDVKTESTPEKAANGVKKGAKKAWHGTKKAAKKVGNKTAELATEGKAKVTDKEAVGWEGPNGQKIYVDDGDKYYWVSDKGKRMWINKDQLKKKD